MPILAQGLINKTVDLTKEDLLLVKRQEGELELPVQLLDQVSIIQTLE
jgi:hypothetical protein